MSGKIDVNKIGNDMESRLNCDSILLNIVEKELYGSKFRTAMTLLFSFYKLLNDKSIYGYEKDFLYDLIIQKESEYIVNLEEKLKNQHIDIIARNLINSEWMPFLVNWSEDANLLSWKFIIDEVNQIITDSIVDIDNDFKLNSNESRNKIIYVPYADYICVGNHFIDLPNVITFQEYDDPYIMLEQHVVLYIQKRLNKNVTENTSSRQNIEDNTVVYDRIIANLTFHDGLETADTLMKIYSNKLADGGVLSCIIPMQFCYAKEYEQCRKYFLSKKCDMIINQVGVENNFKDWYCILVVIKNQNQEICFSCNNDKHRKFYIQSRIKGNECKSRDTLRICDCSAYEFNENVIDSWKKIVKKSTELDEYEILIPEYQVWKTEQKDFVKLVPLKELIETNGFNVTLKKGTKHAPIQLDRLSSNPYMLDYTLLYPNQKEHNVWIPKDLNVVASPYNSCLVKFSRNSVLVGKTFASCEQTYDEKINDVLCDKSNGEIVVDKTTLIPVAYYESRHDVFSFRLTENGKKFITEEYLLRTLTKDKIVKDQARVLMRLCDWNVTDNLGNNTNSKGCYLYEELLYSIRIHVPTLEEQNIIVSKDKDELLGGYVKQIKDDADNYKREIHLRKHALGQTLLNMGSMLQLLELIRQKNNGIIKDTDTIGSKRIMTAGEIFEQLGKSFDYLENQVEMFTVGEGASYKEECFDLNYEVVQYINGHNSHVFSFDYLYDDKQKMMILFSKRALVQILDNIVANACEYGFAESSENNKIRIAMFQNDYNVGLIIENNGKSMLDSIKSKIFDYGSSSSQIGIGKHSGIGCYQIDQLMKRFGGKVEIITDNNVEYKVKYKLTFKS